MVRGKVIVITGAARGIGRYIAHTFAQEGAKLALADILPLDKVSEEIKGMEADVVSMSVDVRDEDAVRTLMEQAHNHYGAVDVLVNNAGIATHASWEPAWPRIRDMDKAFWDRIMDTNLGGTFLCTKHILPYMEARRSGHILNLWGGGSTIGACVYVTSKDAIRTFTRFVAEEERELGICVVALTPGGAIATEDAPEEVRKRLPGVESIGKRFVLAAEAGMELAGQTLTLRDGKLQVVP